MASLAGSAPKRKSHCDVLLDLLQSGMWWTTSEILWRHPMMVHSRVADLRAKGFVVEHETTGKGAAGSRYRLVGSLTEQSGDGPVGGGPSPDRHPSAPGIEPGVMSACSVSESEQLTLRAV
jgi:hypothetical protein